MLLVNETQAVHGELCPWECFFEQLDLSLLAAVILAFDLFFVDQPFNLFLRQIASLGSILAWTGCEVHLFIGHQFLADLAKWHLQGPTDLVFGKPGSLFVI